MGRHRVGVIVRTKDRPVFLRRALDDIAAQTLLAREPGIARVVIVNDGGDAERVRQIVAQHPIASAITVVDNAISRGRWTAANQGVAAARGDEYLVLHDDDDTWHPDFLTETVAFLDRPENAPYAGVATFNDEVRERAEAGGYVELSREPFLREIQHIAFIEMCRGNLFPPIAYLYRSSVHETVGLYDESMSVLADWEFNLRTVRRFDIGMITKPLAYWHKRVETDGARDASRNATAGGEWDYDENIVRLANRLLREDLDGGALGVGYLVNVLQLERREAVERDRNVHLHLAQAIEHLRAGLDGVNQHVTANTERVLAAPGLARSAWRRVLGRR